MFLKNVSLAPFILLLHFGGRAKVLTPREQSDRTLLRKHFFHLAATSNICGNRKKNWLFMATCAWIDGRGSSLETTSAANNLKQLLHTHLHSRFFWADRGGQKTKVFPQKCFFCNHKNHSRTPKTCFILGIFQAYICLIQLRMWT